MACDYTPTKPRGPIAASFAGPGPNVLLPTNLGQGTAITKWKAPIYSFGIRRKSFTTDCSPGPCHNYASKVTRTGIDGTPHFSLYCRPKDITSFRTPGPGAYSPEKAGPNAHPRPPSHSMRSRTKGIRLDKTPAPNHYFVRGNIVGTSHIKPSVPSFLFTSRPEVGRFADNPGPAAYGAPKPCITKKKSPSYSMTSRNQPPSDSTQKPGPGAHSLGKFPQKSGGGFTFGIHHSEFTAPLWPACE